MKIREAIKVVASIPTNMILAIAFVPAGHDNHKDDHCMSSKRSSYCIFSTGYVLSFHRYFHHVKWDNKQISTTEHVHMMKTCIT